MLLTVTLGAPMSNNVPLVLVESPYGVLALTLPEVEAARELAETIAPRTPSIVNRVPRVELLDAEHAGRALDVPPSWLLQRAREGRVPHIKIGKYVRFDIRQVREAFERAG